MKLFRSAQIKSCLGFSLVEAALSVGVLSFGFLSLAPMLGLGLNSARQARDGRVSSQIADSLADQARAGVLVAGISYRDAQGTTCAQPIACYQVQAGLAGAVNNCEQLSIQITPLANPGHPLAYAVLLPPP